MLLSISEIIVSILIIILILLQERSSGLSGIFGGEGGGGMYQTRRGIEKMIFMGTIALAVIFAALSILQLVL